MNINVVKQNDVLTVTLEGRLDTNTSPSLEEVINNLSARDMQKILNQIDLIGQQFGIKNLLYVRCPQCHSEVPTFFRFGPEFFRPTNI
jgi:hypothetical protein